ncbi:NlpC/P60 family protein [Streptomyces sp. NRRL S-118]|uniref:NlpC/P60 family protein n=1 Tax=Streptomyces sp. NRRL S-118 TaxID=1463881 RepID=UPI000A801FBB|nr:NlpC/P60 family protein [Streptomyces sp. NRRL S-118]
MPRFSAEQIYAFARQAGFSPDQATTMTAVALAESGGDSRAHNPVGEDSRGLWQINARAHPDLAQRFDLYDPVDNARAAFLVSHQGDDFSPWTTTHHGPSARYLRFQEEAQAAAVAHGDGAGRGVWTGTTGYGDRRSAGDDGGGQSSTAVPGADPGQPAPSGPGSSSGQPAPTPAVAEGTTASTGPAAQQAATPDRRGAEYGIPLENGDPAAGREYGLPVETGAGPGQPGGPAGGEPPDGSPAEPETGTVAPAQAVDGDKVARFVEAALAQNGDRYVYGAEARLDAEDPTAFDCSELVEWAAHQAGLSITDGALGQFRQLHDAGTTMSVEEAVRTRGALLFSFSSDPVTGEPTGQHVAISLGDGHTIEALNSRAGVGVFEASTRRFNYAAMIPGTGTGGGSGSSGGSGMAPAAPAADSAAAAAAQEPAPARNDGQQPPTAPAPTEPAPTAPAPTVPAPTEPPPTAPAPAGADDFGRRLASDPDRLDQDTLAASLEFTGPTAPIIPAQDAAERAGEPYAPEAADHAFTGDPGTHGFDDGLHATVVPVDLGAHPGPDTDGGHDAVHGGH